MNEILELLSKVSVEVCNDSYDEIALKEVAEKIKQLHKDQIIAAYNRGRASMMGVFMMTAEDYYTKNYEQN